MTRLLVHDAEPDALDGTSVMLRRLYAGRPVLWLGARPARTDVDDVDYRHLRTPRWPFRRGAARFRNLWNRNVLPPLARRLRAHLPVGAGIPVHVTAFEESTAMRALGILRGLGFPPYAAHFPDLLDLAPLSRMPWCGELLRRASAVLAISPRLADHLAPATSAPILVLPPVHSPLVRGSAAPPPVPFTLIMTGALYHSREDNTPEHLQIAAEGWRRFRQHHPDARWLYAGSQSVRLPRALRGVIHDAGEHSDSAFADVLAHPHAALLPTSHDAASPWRWSVPSRIADYLAAALPILHPSASATATSDALDALPAPAHTSFDTADAFVARLLHLANDRAALTEARAAALASAAHFAPDRHAAALDAFLQNTSVRANP